MDCGYGSWRTDVVLSLEGGCANAGIRAMSKRLTVPEMIAAFDQGRFDDLVGAVETVDFEFKLTPYRLDEDHQKRELVKDVSGLANADGGLILLGAKALQSPSAVPTYGEEIEELCPFPAVRFSEKQYRDVLASWIYPPITDVVFRLYVGQFTAPDHAIATILVSKAASTVWPALVRRPMESEQKGSGAIFGYFQRRGTDVAPTGVERLHALLRGGLETEPLRAYLTVIQDNVSELLTRSEQIAGFAERQNRRREAIERTQKRLQLKAEFYRQMNQAILSSGLEHEPNVLLAVYPPDGLDFSALLTRGDPHTKAEGILRFPPSLRQAGFDLNIQYYDEIVTRNTRKFFREGYKLREISRQGLVAAVQQGGSGFLSWDIYRKSDTPLRINPFVLSEFAYVFSLFATELVALSNTAPAELECRIRLTNMAEGGEPPHLLPAEVDAVAPFVQDLIAPGSECDELFSLPGNVEPERMAYHIVEKIYEWFGWQNRLIPYTDGSIINRETLGMR